MLKTLVFYVNEQGITLAPFYDLVNINLYPDVDQDMAMALGDEFDSQQVHAYQLADFAESCQLPRRYVAQQLRQLILKMLTTLQIVGDTSSLDPSFCWDESMKEYFSQYRKIVVSRCKHLSDEGLHITHVEL